jgi:hypothetical protein
VAPYVRSVRTSSGAQAVQIVYSSRRGSRSLEHIGSAHDEVELELLKTVARQRLAAGQGTLDLELEGEQSGGGGPLPIMSSRMGGPPIGDHRWPPGSPRQSGSCVRDLRAPPPWSRDRPEADAPPKGDSLRESSNEARRRCGRLKHPLEVAARTLCRFECSASPRCCAPMVPRVWVRTRGPVTDGYSQKELLPLDAGRRRLCGQAKAG